MASITVPSAIPFQGSLASAGTSQLRRKISDEPKYTQVFVDWSLYRINPATNYAACAITIPEGPNQPQILRGIYIDNSQSISATRVTFPSTGFVFVVPPFSISQGSILTSDRFMIAEQMAGYTYNTDTDHGDGTNYAGYTLSTNNRSTIILTNFEFEAVSMSAEDTIACPTVIETGSVWSASTNTSWSLAGVINISKAIGTRNPILHIVLMTYTATSLMPLLTLSQGGTNLVTSLQPTVYNLNNVSGNDTAIATWSIPDTGNRFKNFSLLDFSFANMGNSAGKAMASMLVVDGAFNSPIGQDFADMTSSASQYFLQFNLPPGGIGICACGCTVSNLGSQSYGFDVLNIIGPFNTTIGLKYGVKKGVGGGSFLVRDDGQKPFQVVQYK